MKTEHHLHICDARRMTPLPKASVDLVVTSPPYPMIAMWDDLFSGQDARIAKFLSQGRGLQAFEAMHRLLDPVWREVYRVLKPGGIVCINIGDATRTLGGEFALYPNHARILQHLVATGFAILPDILWRKPTNAPTKFMGSGMLPAGAYVTLEHEYILVARKGGKREFLRTEDKLRRRESAFFWEERNQFFSDVWMEVRGASQVIAANEARTRSAAFPFEVAYRLVSMYSVKGDLVLDPFWGAGTTSAAAMAAGRNSVGLEIEPGLAGALEALVPGLAKRVNAYIEKRLARHVAFVSERLAADKPVRYRNKPYGFPVVTRQEMDLLLNAVTGVALNGGGTAAVDYAAAPQPAFCGDWEAVEEVARQGGNAGQRHSPDPPAGGRQLNLF